MRHKYIKDENANTSIGFDHKICIICGLQKYKTHNYEWTTTHYKRSGMNFTYSPDCINWNSKDDIIMD